MCCGIGTLKANCIALQLQIELKSMKTILETFLGRIRKLESLILREIETKAES